MKNPHPILTKILSNTRIKQYPQGQIVIYEGDSPAEIYLVKSGHLKVYDLDKEGNEKILSIVKPGDVMPYSFFSGNKIPNKWYYQTLCDSEIYTLDRDTLLHAMNADAELTMALINNFSREVHELLTRLSSLGKSKVHSKLIALFKYFVVALGQGNNKTWWQVPFPASQQLLADITGITRESCALAMKELLASGLVRYKKQTVLEINTKKIMDLEH